MSSMVGGQDVIFENQVVSDRKGNDHRAGAIRLQRRMEQPGLRRLQLGPDHPRRARQVNSGSGLGGSSGSSKATCNTVGPPGSDAFD